MVAAHDGAVPRAQLLSLKERADGLLSHPGFSVVEKTRVPPSGDKHDFYAIGAYSWPNPASRDGLPYIRRDGLYNPEAYSSTAYDKGRLRNFVDAVRTLSIAHILFSDRKYAVKVAQLLRKWFVDPQTSMNPNFRHAAAHPGVHDGRHSGVIEGAVFIELLDYVNCLNRNNSLSSELLSALREWFAELSNWLVHHDFGRAERYSTNNHGGYYLAQVMAFSSFAGLHRRARKVIPIAKSQISWQISHDGRMPRELERPNALFYSIYALRAFSALAKMAASYNEDLWLYKPPGRSAPAIPRALLFLAPYLTGRKSWGGEKDTDELGPYAAQLCRMAAFAYRSELTFEMLRFVSSQPGVKASHEALIGLDSPDGTAAGNALFRDLSLDDQPGLRDSGVARRVYRLITLLTRKKIIPSRSIA